MDTEQAAAVLKGGGLVAIPTETVYGLAADAENELAVRRIFAVKGRPSTHPLIVHVGSAAELPKWARRVSPEATRLGAAFWPGPLTLVLERSPRASDAVTGGQDTVALRVPRHPLTLDLLARLGGGLAAPSANRFGKVSPTTAAHVVTDLGAEVDGVLDGGPCEVGIESTIVDLSGDAPAVLRPGGISPAALEQVLGRAVAVRESGAVRVPGALPSHYAPRAGVVGVPPSEVRARASNLLRSGRAVAVMASDLQALPAGAKGFAVPSDAQGLARVLYATLREVDQAGADVVVVALPSGDGIGLAVLDRLARAAAGGHAP